MSSEKTRISLLEDFKKETIHDFLPNCLDVNLLPKYTIYIYIYQVGDQKAPL